MRLSTHAWYLYTCDTVTVAMCYGDKDHLCLHMTRSYFAVAECSLVAPCVEVEAKNNHAPSIQQHSTDCYCTVL